MDVTYLTNPAKCPGVPIAQRQFSAGKHASSLHTLTPSSSMKNAAVLQGIAPENTSKV